jgi:hypothetical protein
MKFILDFDRVIFDVESYLRDVTKAGLREQYAEPQIWNTLDARAYLYPDALEFLGSRDPRTMAIVSAMSPELGPFAREFQKQKLAHSGMTTLVQEVILMEGDKGIHVKQILDGNPTMFIDDKMHQLMSVREYCPEVQLVQMLRPRGDGRGEGETPFGIRVVTSFGELSQLS